MKVQLQNNAIQYQAANNGVAPLWWASDDGLSAIVSQLLDARATVNKASNSGYTPLQKAEAKGHSEVVQLLINAGAQR